VFRIFLTVIDIASYINFVDRSEEIPYRDGYDKLDFLRDVLNDVDGHEAAIFFNDFYMSRRNTTKKANPNGT